MESVTSCYCSPCVGDVSTFLFLELFRTVLGGMFAGHDESAGEMGVHPKTGAKVKLFYGMSSSTAMKKHSGAVAEYRASEGKAVLVPYRFVMM